MFQLLSENPELQPILSNEFETSFRKVSNDTRHVRSLLTSLLQLTKFTALVVDGIDEIEYVERQFLLKQLLEMNRDCENMKLLISSRAEDDIARLLRDKGEPVLVNTKNGGHIRAYLQHRADSWLSSNEFDEETSAEIRRLLGPLASRANGQNSSYPVDCVLISNTNL